MRRESTTEEWCCASCGVTYWSSTRHVSARVERTSQTVVSLVWSSHVRQFHEATEAVREVHLPRRSALGAQQDWTGYKERGAASSQVAMLSRSSE